MENKSNNFLTKPIVRRQRVTKPTTESTHCRNALCQTLRVAGQNDYTGWQEPK